MQIVALDRMVKEVSEEELKRLIPEELAATIQLYLEDKIRSFHFRKDRPGVVFFLEFDSIELAKQALDELPVVKEGLFEFEFIPVGPLLPLAELIDK